MTWAVVAVIVLTLGAIGYFVHVGKVFQEKKYLKNQEKARQDEERKAALAKAKQEEREIRHEKRLREIDSGRPDDLERVLNTWPDDAEDPPPVSTGNGAGGGAGGNLH